MGSTRGKSETPGLFNPPDVSEEDIYEALRDVHAYLDVTPGDLREIYRLAFRHAAERLFLGRNAGQAMVTEVVTVGKRTPLPQVVDTMARSGVSGVPVLDPDGTVAGVVSESDVLHHMAGGRARNPLELLAQCLAGDPPCLAGRSEARAEDVMTAPAVTVTEDTPLSRVAALLAEHRINRVPVVDHQGRLVGLVSRTDLLHLPSQEPGP